MMPILSYVVALGMGCMAPVADAPPTSDPSLPLPSSPEAEEPTSSGDDPATAATPASGETDPPSSEDGEPDPASEEAEEVPAPLPPKGPAPPAAREPHAWGGGAHAPLPPPPPRVEAARTSNPWRGRVWLGVGLAASIPLAGRPPAAGGVIALAGGLDLGWRINRIVALHTGISTFAHDAAQRTVAAADGAPVQEVETGRITAFDLVTARVLVPAHRRIEPWAEAGAGIGARRGPFAVRREAAGLIRVGVGVDFWLAPSLTLGASVAYRATFIHDTVGHGLRAGADLGLHW